MTPAMSGFLWCGLAGLASALATYLIKVSTPFGPGWNLPRLALLGGAAATYALGFVFYSVALQRLQVSLAYPVMTGIAMAAVALIGYAALNEPITASRATGMALVALGVVALSR